MTFRPLSLFVLLCSTFCWTQAVSPEEAAYYKKEIRPVLTTFCIECHKEGKQVGFLAMRDLNQINAHRGALRSAISQLRNRTMPPAQEEQPDETDRILVSDWLEKVLRESAKEMGPYAGAVTARRLNRLEYDNTIRDLLGLKMKFSETFPSDGGGGEGFNNNGETLFLPVILMERYLDAAEAITDEAVIIPEQTRTFAPADFEKPATGDRTGHLHAQEEASIFFPVTMKAPHVLTLHAEAINAPQANLVLKLDGIAAQSFTLKNQDAKPVEIQVELFRGWHRITLVVEKGEINLRDLVLKDKPKAITADRQEAHRRLFGDISSASLQTKSPTEKRAAASQLLSRFARLAFRQPVSASDIEKYLQLYDRSASRGELFETSMKLAYKAILVSPRFLYRTEKDHTEPGLRPITDHELATRLSYFLWNSTPDATLNQLADAGQLNQPEVLKAQLERMLADPKSGSFIENFTEQWLGTNAVGDTVSFTGEEYKGIFTVQLAADLRREPVLLMDYILKNNRSLLELLNADYTFINERLAKHYQIEGVHGENFRQVTITDGRRGGLLGLGAVHMLTSHTKQTSPVLRGTWVLNTLLGTPVPPPPPNVPPLSQASNKKKGASLREQLAVHRANAECSACHNVIDPIGFSLENFDMMGRWREKDEKGKPIDPSGKTASGVTFKGFADFKQQLVHQKREFGRQIISKVLGYALGRSLVDRDDGTIEDLLSKMEAQNYQAKVLLQEVILSAPFRNRNELENHSPVEKPKRTTKAIDEERQKR